jgi:hypothetical protein
LLGRRTDQGGRKGEMMGSLVSHRWFPVGFVVCSNKWVGGETEGGICTAGLIAPIAAFGGLRWEAGGLLWDW